MSEDVPDRAWSAEDIPAGINGADGLCAIRYISEPGGLFDGSAPVDLGRRDVIHGAVLLGKRASTLQHPTATRKRRNTSHRFGGGCGTLPLAGLFKKADALFDRIAFGDRVRTDDVQN